MATFDFNRLDHRLYDPIRNPANAIALQTMFEDFMHVARTNPAYLAPHKLELARFCQLIMQDEYWWLAKRGIPELARTREYPVDRPTIMNAILKAAEPKRFPPPVKDPNHTVEKELLKWRVRETLECIETGASHLDSKEREILRRRVRNYVANLEGGGNMLAAINDHDSIEELSTRISRILLAEGEERFQTGQVLGLIVILRGAAAFKLEADVLENAVSADPHFFRSFESWPNDAAIIVDTQRAESLPQHSTDRLLTLYQDYVDSQTTVFIPVEMKSFQYSTRSQKGKHDFDEEQMKETNVSAHHGMNAIIKFSKAQVKDCDILLITSVACSDWIAVLPMEYVRQHMGPEERARGRYQFSLGATAFSLVQACPFPPSVSPFLVPKTDVALAVAIQNLVAHANDSSAKLFNSFSGLEYSMQPDITPKTFQALLPANDTEARLRSKIWKAFDDVGKGQDPPQLLLRNSVICPYTSDVRIDHYDGAKIIIELKTLHARVEDLGNQQVRFSHKAKALDYDTGIFVYSAPWDYIFTTTSENEGYLLSKDTIPTSFWHRDPGQDNWMSHNMAIGELNKYRIELTGTSDNIVRQFRKVLCGTDNLPTPTLIESRLTAADIIRTAGPCPPGLRRAPREDVAPAELLIGLANPDTDDENADQQWQGPRLITEEVEARLKVHGGLSSVQDGQLYRVLMEQCCEKGQGCVLYLGNWHDYPSLAMVQHVWSPCDKEHYLATGQPPLFVGMLPSETKMVIFAAITTTFRDRYAPKEPAVTNVQRYIQASPCLLVVSSFANELCHATPQRWVIPSVHMPKFHAWQQKVKQDKLNKPEMKDVDDKKRLLLLLEGGISIARFVTGREDLRATILSFLDRAATTVGLGKIEVEDTQPYLRTVGEYKRLGELNFHRILRGAQGLRQSATATGGEDGQETDEEAEDDGDEDDEL